MQNFKIMFNNFCAQVLVLPNKTIRMEIHWELREEIQLMWILTHAEKWYFDGKEVEVVSYYKYLGLVVTSMLNWSKAQKTLASQAEKALYALFRYCYHCGTLPYHVTGKLFDKTIVHILCYGSEKLTW